MADAESYEPIKSPGGMASARYGALKSGRDPFLMRARNAASLTLSFLFRQVGENGSTAPEIAWDSLGAYCITNLASKVVFALFPPGQPPMKLSPSPAILREAEQSGDPQTAQENLDAINKGLSKVEREFVDAFEEDGDRVALNVGILKQIVGGTHGYQFYPNGTVRGISLDHFVCRRDPQGNLIEFVIEDSLDWATLPNDIHEAIEAQGFVPPPPGHEVTFQVYTHGVLVESKPPHEGPVWEVYQEVWNFTVPGSETTYAPDFLPYLFTPWLLLDGEDYGRSYVEYFEGDLQTAEANTQTVTEGAAAIAKLLIFVHPGGLTSRKAVAEAENGAVISGRAEDVTVPDFMRKSADFQAAGAVIDKAEQRLSRAFLLTSSVQRSGERVTATEIRAVAGELEGALGGVYSQQVIFLQKPFVRLKLQFLQKARRVTALPKGTTKFTITAGLAALGRNAEMDALQQWAQFMATMFGPNWLQVLGPNAMKAVAQRGADALHFDTAGILPSDEEMAQLQQQQRSEQLIQQLGPEAIKQFGGNLTATQVADTNAGAKVGAEQIKAQAAPPPQAPPQEGGNTETVQ